MNTSRNLPSRLRSEQGQALVLMAVTMVGLLGIAALSVDVGYLLVARNQLQNVADGAALAGARSLGAMYQNMTYPEQQVFVCGEPCITTIQTTAESVANHNSAAGKIMSLDYGDDNTGDVLIGHWDGDNFTPGLDQPDAVQVISRRDDAYNGPVTTFFARVLGIDSAPVNAIAVAAMTGQGTAQPGEVELPIGISRYFFDESGWDGEGEPPWCHETIRFYPTNDPTSCAGWTSFEYNANDVTLRDILDGDDGYLSPTTVANETYFNFTGGTLSNPTFEALLNLFKERGFASKPGDDREWYLDSNGDHLNWNQVLYSPYDQYPYPGGVDADGNAIPQAQWPDGNLRYYHRWDTSVPVYDWGDCSNPNTTIKIVGFAQVMLTDVRMAPDKLVEGKVLCGYTSPEDNRGGGGEYGIKGPIPGLVK